MKVLAVLFVLISCQQIFAAKHASFKEFQKAHAVHTSVKLEEMKAKLSKDFEGTLNMAVPEFMKTTSFKEMKARMAQMPKTPLPDFAARKATLQGMKAKLEEIRKTASKMDKPSKEFLEDVKKTLAESMDPKVAPFQLPPRGPVPVVQKPAKTATAVEPKRFVENFGEELVEAQDLAENAQTVLLAASRQARQYMVEQVFDVFGGLVYDLANGTSTMMHMRKQVVDLIEYEETLGAAADCLNAQRENLRVINYNFGQQINRCATTIYYPARRYINTIFYPYLDYVVYEINSMHYLVMNMLSRSNVARDQESVLNVLDVLVRGEKLRGEMFGQEVLYWEGNAFADAHLGYRNDMYNCMDDLVGRYRMGSTYIMNQLYVCAIPTK